MRYCPTCKTHFEGDGPPYSVLHVMGSKEHLHPVTREPAVPIEFDDTVCERAS